MWPNCERLRGFICTYHSAAVGSNPKHTIYTFSICFVEIVLRKGRKWTKKRPGLTQFKNIFGLLYHSGSVLIFLFISVHLSFVLWLYFGFSFHFSLPPYLSWCLFISPFRLIQFLNILADRAETAAEKTWSNQTSSSKKHPNGGSQMCSKTTLFEYDPQQATVWPEKNRQMSIKVAQKWFH